MNDYNVFDQPPETLGDAILAAGAFLSRHELVYAHGTDNPHDEAAWLCIDAIGLSAADEAIDYAIKLTAPEIDHMTNWLRQRVEKRTPAAYLTGTAWFCGLPFFVDHRVLIPRSPIGSLINEGFAPWLEAEPKRVLDLCTGSGCIAVACAYAFERSEVIASDFSEEALEVAQLNIDHHDLNERIAIVHGDLFENVEGCFDLIVSNPPYVDHIEMAQLDAEFEHEPSMALEAGDDGLDLVHRMLKEAKQYLSPNGLLVIEVGNSADALDASYPQIDFEWLHFDHGVGGVFVMRYDQLPDSGPY